MKNHTFNKSQSGQALVIYLFVASVILCQFVGLFTVLHNRAKVHESVKYVLTTMQKPYEDTKQELSSPKISLEYLGDYTFSSENKLQINLKEDKGFVCGAVLGYVEKNPQILDKVKININTFEIDTKQKAEAFTCNNGGLFNNNHFNAVITKI